MSFGFGDLEATDDPGEHFSWGAEARFQWIEDGVEGEKTETTQSRGLDEKGRTEGEGDNWTGK